MLGFHVKQFLKVTDMEARILWADTSSSRTFKLSNHASIHSLSVGCLCDSKTDVQDARIGRCLLKADVKQLIILLRDQSVVYIYLSWQATQENLAKTTFVKALIPFGSER